MKIKLKLKFVNVFKYLFEILLTVNTLFLQHYRNCDSDGRSQTLDFRLKGGRLYWVCIKGGYLELNNYEELWVRS